MNKSIQLNCAMMHTNIAVIYKTNTQDEYEFEFEYTFRRRCAFAPLIVAQHEVNRVCVCVCAPLTRLLQRLQKIEQ